MIGSIGDIPVLTLSITATADLVGGRAVDLDGGYSTAAGNSLGALSMDTSTGNEGGVVRLGVKTVEAGGAIAADEQVEVGTDGKYVAYSAGVIVGKALTAAAADGDPVSVDLYQN